MKNTLIIGFVLLLGFSYTEVHAQQQNTYTFYRLSQVFYNPAVAGANKNSELTGNFRSEWSGVQGAPDTQTLAFDTYVGKNVGLGLTLLADKTFYDRNTEIAANLSYALEIGTESTLLFGLKASASFYDQLNENITSSNLIVDPGLQLNGSGFIPNIGVGIYLKGRNYFIGLSAPALFEVERVEENDGILLSNAAQNYFLAGGYEIPVNNWKLIPSVQLRYNDNAPLSLEATMELEFSRFHFGAAHRFNEASGIFTLFDISSSISIGYAYEFVEQNALGSISNGTHELMTKIRFGGNGDAKNFLDSARNDF